MAADPTPRTPGLEERLRNYADRELGGTYDYRLLLAPVATEACELMREAADEIARLTAEREQVVALALAAEMTNSLDPVEAMRDVIQCATDAESTRDEWKQAAHDVARRMRAAKAELAAHLNGAGR